MKKYSIGLAAVILAVGMSAFSPKSQQFVSRFYLDNTGWHAIDESLTCPEGQLQDCKVMINGVLRQIYKSQSTADPLRYNP